MATRWVRPSTDVRVWSSQGDAARVRRPTDVLLLALSVVTLVVLGLAAPGPTGADTAIATLLVWLEPVFGWLWSVAYALLALWALAVVLLAALSRGRRRLLIDLAAAACLAFAVALAVGAFVGTDATVSVSALVSSGPPVVYVPTRVAVLTSVVIAASPHLARPWRYAGRLVVALGAVAAIGLGATNALGAGAAITVGIAAAAVVHLVLGSPAGRLTVAQVQVALAELGVDVVEVRPLPSREAGEALFAARSGDGDDLLVKVYGRDAWDSQVVDSTWAALTVRGERARLRGGRRSRVEHEAVLTLLAARAGVPTLDVVTVGLAEQGDALLVTRAPATSLDDLRAAGPDALDDALLAELWGVVTMLGQAGIAHGGIDGGLLVVRADGTAALMDFDDAEQAADDVDRCMDRARLLVATALAVGPERSVRAALTALGPDGVAQLLPYLQPVAIGRRMRADLRGRDWTLDELRESAVVAAGVEAPPLERLRRVTPRSVGILVLVALVVYVVLTTLAGADLASIAEAIRTAEWPWLVAALLLAPVIQVPSAGVTMGSTTVRLRFIPVLVLQYAIQFIALVLPATAARLALEVRFFQRFGIPPATALSFGVIGSVSGFVVQIGLLLVILVAGLPGFTSDLSRGSDDASSDGSSGSLLAVLVALLVVTLAVSLLVPRLRRRLTARIPNVRSIVAAQGQDARAAFGVLRRPAKIATMLGGNLGLQLLQAVVLALCLSAFGESAYFSQLVLINTAVSLFSGIMPIPGGMGVTEAGLTWGLQAVGVPAPIAVSTAITYRLVTFYLPPIWGAVAMRWLRKREYV